MSNEQHLTHTVGDALEAELAERVEAEAQAYEAVLHPTQGGDHTDQRQVEALAESWAIISQWVDEMTGEVIFDHGAESIEHVARKIQERTGVNRLVAAKKARKQLNAITLKQWVTNPETGRNQPVANERVLGQVQAYFGEPDGRPPFLLHPDAPTFIFTTLDTRSARYVEGECEALVVAYQSPKVQERVWTDRDQGWTETFEVQDDMDFGGTIGVVRYYPTALLAQEAMEQLNRAVWSVRKALITADREDTPLEEQPESIDDLTW